MRSLDDKFREAYKIINNWLIPITLEERKHISECIRKELKDSTDNIMIFVKKIIASGIYELLDSNILLPGTGCFYGSLLMCLFQGEHINPDRLDGIFEFTIMYMLSDYYLDDVTINSTDKKYFIDTARKVLSGKHVDIPNNNTKTSKFLTVLNDSYQKIIKRTPDAEIYLYEAIHAEILSMIVQKKPDLSLNLYYHISEWKGGSTVCAIQSILGLPVTNDEYELGALIQLCDDALDINDDIELNIYTAAIYEYERRSNLDEYICDVIIRIGKLEKYNLFQPILLFSIVVAVVANDHCTPKLKELLEPYMLIDIHQSEYYRKEFGDLIYSNELISKYIN